MSYQPLLPAATRPISTHVNHLEAVTVCVDYADFLDESLSHNLHHFDEFVVVTSHEDKATQAVCDRHGVTCVLTDVFTMRGEPFNKGLAINLGLAHLRHLDWVLHLDADIVLPDRFRTMLNKAHLDRTCLYGADRVNVVGVDHWQKIKSSPAFARQFHHRYLVEAPKQCALGARLLHNEFGWCPIGYFQLWHSSIRRRYPVNQGSAEHTDVLFALQWPVPKRRLLPTAFVYHLESESARMGANWSGRKTKPFKVKSEHRHAARGMITTTPRFEKAVKFVLDHETVFKPRSKWGNYDYATWECDPDDPGGLTKFGIDQRSHPSDDIKNLTLDRAKQIYFIQYWVPCGADHMPPSYGEVLFDIKVNGGNGPDMVQQALNALLPADRQLAVDGVIGIHTLQAMQDEGKAGLLEFLHFREDRYRELAAEKPGMAKFLEGWLNRNRDLKEFVLGLL